MPFDEFKSVNVYVKGKLLLPSAACDGIKATISHTPPPIFLIMANPLLFISVDVSHFKETFDLLILEAVNDFKVTGKGAHPGVGTKITTLLPLAAPPVIVATIIRSLLT